MNYKTIHLYVKNIPGPTLQSSLDSLIYIPSILFNLAFLVITSNTYKLYSV